MGHRNYICDGCESRNFHGRRFHCLRCVNYDLCRECYEQHVETLQHRANHPMRLLLDDRYHHQLPELLFSGELGEVINLSHFYTCPYCGTFGYTARQLIDHVVAIHRQAETYVICPLCVGLPGIELGAIRNLARHLLDNHIEHANLLDPNTSPQRHVLSRVPRRRRRQQPQNNQGNPNSNNTSSLARSISSRMDSEAGFDILRQLSELRRLRPELSFSPAPPNYMESRSRPTEHQIVIHRQPAIGGPAQGCAKASTASTSRLLEPSDADRYLLHRWMTDQQADVEATLRENVVREKHALFTEHLLLSMLSEEELELPPNSRLLADPSLQTPSQSMKHSNSPDSDDDAKSMDAKSEDQNSGLKCKYTPSHAMMLMSLPWARPWSEQTKRRYIELQGATLDESSLASGEQQDID